MQNYATVVFPNGRIVQFRQRDTNRFKAALISPSTPSIREPLMVDFLEQYHIDYDDCNGTELATFLSFVMNSGNPDTSRCL